MRKTIVLLVILSFALLFLAFTPAKAAGTCSLTAGQVVINEILPRPTDTVEWVELYNTTASPLDLSYCYLDDLASGGGSPFQIAAGQTIPAHGFWTASKTGYFNNDGDDVRLLLDDAATVLDSYTYGATDVGNSWYRLPDGQAWSTVATPFPTIGASNDDACGDGTWTPNTLEIHHIDVGQGDSTLIVSPTGISLLFDAGATSVGAYVHTVLGCTQLDYIAISHFHDDHVGTVGSGGLWDLVENQGFTATTTLVRDYSGYVGEKDLTAWQKYLDTDAQAKIHPQVTLDGSVVDLGGGVSIKILAVNGNGEIKAGDFHLNSDAPSENDYSLGFLLTFNQFTEWFGGDLSGELSGNYHDIELSAAKEIGDVDVYRVHHHGSSHSSNSVFVAQLDPEVSLISVGDNNTFGHPTQLVMDRLLATSTVYMTERGDPATNIGAAIIAGNILVTSSDGLSYTVNGTPYSTDTPNRVDADGDGYFSDAGIDPDDSNPDLIPAPNGGCDPTYQVCLCRATAGQVVLNEVLPAPSTGNSEWAELYNTTALPINIGLCNIDDADNTKNPSQIPANTIIPPHGFYLTPALSSYFNNTGDDARLLAGDAATVLDTFTFGATAYDLSWHRTPDGGPWAAAPGAPTPGTANNPLKTLTARSQGNNDGWILESTEKSNVGGTLNLTGPLILGDDKLKRQYRSVLSFVTYTLPDNAVITKVALRLKYQSVAPAGTDPITLLQGIFVDVRKGYFGVSPALELADFKFAASKTAGPFKPALSSGWYTVSLPQTTFASINKQTTLSGLTQLRLRFKLDDNNNAIANMLNLFSGNSVVVNRPALIIEYYIP